MDPAATAPHARRPFPWGLLALAALLGLAGTAALVLLVPPQDLLPLARRTLDTTVATLQELGPVLFYAAGAALCLVGAPVSPIWIAGAAAFGPWTAFAGSVAMLVTAISGAHLVANRVLRTLLLRLLARLGRDVPQVKPENHLAFALLLRITPGVPFVLQNNLIPLAGVPLRVNLAAGLPVQSAYAAGFCFLGGAFLSGSAGTAIAGVGILAAAALVVRMLRRRFAAGARPPA